uniref:CSON008928 protein n=1 Tax=Culicoides sonorensis TaxID=179676 RepID=A0A336KF24_CULSO
MKVTIAVLFACLAVASANYGHAAHGYGHAGHHVQPVQHQVHSYAAHAPKVDCGHNLLVSCQPVTAKAPCVPNHAGHGYAAPAHHAAPAHYAAPAHHAAPAYEHKAPAKY